MKKVFLILFITLLIGSFAQASIIDAPHNETNFVSCSTCHNYSLWWQSSPITDSGVRETISNAICLNCHEETGHSSVGMGDAHRDELGLWSLPCVDCHSVHLQEQLNW